MITAASAIPKSTVSDPETITPRISRMGISVARAFLGRLRLLRRGSLLLLRAYGKSRCIVGQFGFRCFLVSGAWSEIRAHAMLACRVQTRVLNVWLVCGRSFGSCCPSCVREKPLAVELLSCPCGQEARNMPRFGVRQPGRRVRLRHLGKRCCAVAGAARLAGRGVRRRRGRRRVRGCWRLLLVGIG